MQLLRIFSLLVSICDYWPALMAVRAEFILVPPVNEAVVGESTYFDCTTTTHTNEVNWHHYRVGAKDHEDICLYCLGKVHPQYDTRIRVERNFNTGTYRLNIISVLWEDAGSYICQENGGIGDSLLAQLVVLEYAPSCRTNIAPDGVVGPNKCNLEPDELQMSCNVSYHGNIAPILQWREVRSLDPIQADVYCMNSGYQMSCTLAINASFGLNGSSYVCETNRSSTTQHNCSSGVVRIIHVNIDNSSTEMVLGTKETITCSANSSQSCSYKWKWVDGVNEEVVSYGAALQPRKTGWHKCEAECSIRGIQCTVLSRLVHVTEQKTESYFTLDVVLGTIALVVSTSSIVIYLLIKFDCNRLTRRFMTQMNKSLSSNTLRRQQLPVTDVQLMSYRTNENAVQFRGYSINT